MLLTLPFMVYAATSEWNPSSEITITPFDPEIKLEFDLESIIVNDTNIGGEVKIIGYGSEKTATIKAISDDHIEVEASRMNLELDRNDGSVKISRGTRFARLACERSIFTM